MVPSLTHREMLEALSHMTHALGPYREDIVLAGGFVPFIYREARLFADTATPALLSGDIDLVAPKTLNERDRPLRVPPPHRQPRSVCRPEGAGERAAS